VTTRKKLLLPAMMSRAGWDVVKQRADVEAIAYEYSLSTAAFHALLRDVDGVALGLTQFGEAELEAAPKLRVVARHGVAVSYACPTRSTVASANGLPAICSASGSPSFEKPQHTLSAGAHDHHRIDAGNWTIKNLFGGEPFGAIGAQEGRAGPDGSGLTEINSIQAR